MGLALLSLDAGFFWYIILLMSLVTHIDIRLYRYINEICTKNLVGRSLFKLIIFGRGIIALATFYVV